MSVRMGRSKYPNLANFGLREREGFRMKNFACCKSGGGLLEMLAAAGVVQW